MTSFWEHVLTVGGINGIAAWGLSIAIRSGQLSVGHAALAGVAGYLAGLITRDGGSLWLAGVCGVALAGVLGVLFSIITIKLEHLFLAIATLALGEAIAILVSNSPALGEAAGLAGIPLAVGLPTVAIVVALAFAAEIFILRPSAFHFAMHLLATDPILVGLSGRDWRYVRIASFGLSAAVVGLAGVLQAHVFGVIQPQDLEFSRSLDFLVYAVIGGVHSGYGPILGALGLTLFPELLNFSSSDRMVLNGVFLLGTLLLREEGLISRIPVRILRYSKTAKV